MNPGIDRIPAVAVHTYFPSMVVSLKLLRHAAQNVHTMAELKLSGNHLKGSRPVLSFHKSFDGQPHLQLLKEMFSQVRACACVGMRVWACVCGHACVGMRVWAC